MGGWKPRREEDCYSGVEGLNRVQADVDCSPPDSSVHGILQTRIPEWVAIPFSREYSDPGIEAGSPILQADS